MTDTQTLQVLELPAGSSSQVTLPFTGLRNPMGIAVDAAGNVYVADSGNNRVLELPAGSSSQITLPFTGLNSPDGVAVDASGDVFVTSGDRVLELSPPFFPSQQPVPFINIGPLAVQAGLAGRFHYEITLTGRNFQDWSYVQVTLPGGGTIPVIPCPREGDELVIAVPAAALATPGTGTVRVVTPGTGGSTSNVQPLFVTPANVAVSSEGVSARGTATTGGNGQGTAGSVTVSGSGGSGTLAAAIYNANPGTAPKFTATGAYFDAWLQPGSTYSSVTITDCDLDGGTQVQWYDAASASWVAASDQSYDPVSQCASVTVNANTVPSLAQLSGTMFGVASTHPVLASPGASGALQTLNQGSGSCDLLLNGGTSVTAAGVADINGTSTSPLCLNGGSTLSSSGASVQGGVQNNNSTVYGPLSTQQPAATSLLAGLQAPTAPGAACPGAACPGRSNLNRGHTYDLLPGTYTQAVNVNGGATACVAPGVYVLEANWTLNSSALHAYGSAGCPALPAGTTDPGVLLYFAQGHVVLNGSADLTQLQAMQTGPYAGLLYWQAGTGSATLNDTSAFAGGAWYEPNGTLTLNGSAQLTASYVGASTITANGGTALTVTGN